MIRLPLSTIDLSRRDLSDYERRKSRNDAALLKRDYYLVARIHSSSSRSIEGVKTSFDAMERRYANREPHDKRLTQSTPPRSPTLQEDTTEQEYPLCSSKYSRINHGDASLDESELQEFIQTSLENSPENTTLDTPKQNRSITPSKDQFYYGGFVETHFQPRSDNNTNLSSFCTSSNEPSCQELISCSTRRSFHPTKPPAANPTPN
jgi:hypothetical protein